MLFPIVIAFALVFHPLVTSGQTDISTNPRIYTNQSFWAHHLELPLDGSCHALNREYNRNVGSVYIPCEAASGKKNMCTLYSDKKCESKIVVFDRSHSAMFEAPKSDKGPIAYVGGRVESIKCQVVDSNHPVANTNGHVSTQHPHKCPGDFCSSNGDCYLSTEKGQCNSGRCQRT